MDNSEKTHGQLLAELAVHQSLVEGSLQGIAIISDEGHCLFANPAFAAMCGVDAPIDIIGQPISPFIAPEELSRLAAYGEARLRGEVAPSRYELQGRQLDGTPIWVELFVSMIDWEGRPTRLLMCIDITERRQAEEAMRAREVQIRLIVDNVPLLIAYLDQSRCFCFVNQTFADWLGLTPEVVIGRHAKDVLGETAYLNVAGYMDEVLLGQTVAFKLEMNYASGVRYVSARYVPHSDAHGRVQGFFALVMDMTDIKQLQKQLVQKQKMEAIGTFASGIAHEFNNILNVVMAYIGLAEGELPFESPVQSYLGEVDAALQRAKDLLNQMATFSRQMPTAYKPLDMAALVQDALRFFRVSITKTIDIREHIAAAPLMVLADSTQLHQILMNLFVNAEYAMRLTGGCLEVCLEGMDRAEVDGAVQAELPAGAYVCLRVRDTGPSMLPEVREHIFEPFYTTKAVGEGTGMGLAIVHSIVTTHGGAIAVDSKLGEGTTFAIYLPRYVEATAKPKDVAGPTPVGLGCILLVDDEPALTRGMAKALTQLGYQGGTYTEPEAALDAFETQPHHFDLLLTDQAMPGMTGIQLAEHVRQIRADLPAILCSGFSHTIEDVQSWEMSFDAFCMKPLRIQELAEIIRQVLVRRQRASQGDAAGG
ncbi:hypothetical protein C2W62_27070 [Candidatus Entotheonella serta]|nr:hypothetical protein C2W62_27070 [Candidatus Entotheonella serta]